MQLLFVDITKVKFSDLNKQGNRLAPEYFQPTNFVEDAFQKDESVFFNIVSSRNTFWPKILSEKNYNFKKISDFEEKIFWLLAEIFTAGLWKLHSMCPEEHFEEMCFLVKKKMKFVNIFGLWAKSFRTFGETFSTGLS